MANVDKFEEKAEELLLNELSLQMNDGLPIKEDDIETLAQKDPDKFEEIRSKVSEDYQSWLNLELKKDIKISLSKFSPDDNEGVFNMAGVCPSMMGFPEMYEGSHPDCQMIHCYECWLNAVS